MRLRSICTYVLILFLFTTPQLPAQGPDNGTNQPGGTALRKVLGQGPEPNGFFGPVSARPKAGDPAPDVLYTKVLHSPEVSNILRRIALPSSFGLGFKLTPAAGEVSQAKKILFACYNFQRRRCTKGYDLQPVSMQRRFQGSRGLKHVRPLKMGDNQA